ncbi:MAG: GFA family protein [Pseudomonadota bacterium]
MIRVKGSCLCGGIEFEVSDPPSGATHCHCSRCRKTRGTAHATNYMVALDSLRYLRGEELLSKYRLPEAKFYAHWFCSVCGSTMPRFDEARGFAVVPMGAFDEDPISRPNRHIHVASKAAWDVITDGLPQFDAGPPTL